MAIVARVAHQDLYDNPLAITEAGAQYRAETGKPDDYVLFVEYDPSERFYNIEDVTAPA